MEENKSLRIVMFPWLAFGHMLPFLELSKSLALKGHKIFYISTPRNLQRLQKIPQNLSNFITFVPIPLPQIENLPPHAEATTDVGFDVGHDLLKKAYDGLQEPMTQFLESLNKPYSLDYIIYDFACYWMPQIAEKLGIRKVFFSIFTARLVTVCGPKLIMEKEDGAGNLTSSEMLTNPPWSFSGSTYYFPFEARMVYKGITDITSSGVSDSYRIRTCLNGCDLIAIRSCFEIEREYLQLLENLNEKIVVPVGLLPPSNTIDENNKEDGDEVSPSIIGWLNSQKNRSVVYVAFGSELEPSQEQLNELAYGVEQSGLPFLWVFRRSKASTLELPNGFEERTRERGLVWTSWVPQVKILSHGSVGGFLTHSGWSSIIETLMVGKPLIMFPLAVDQGLNARLIEEIKVGFEIPRNKEDGSFTRDSVAKSLLMVLKEEAGKVYKEELKNIYGIIGNQDLHNKYIDKFSDYLYHQA